MKIQKYKNKLIILTSLGVFGLGMVVGATTTWQNPVKVNELKSYGEIQYTDKDGQTKINLDSKDLRNMQTAINNHADDLSYLKENMDNLSSSTGNNFDEIKSYVDNGDNELKNNITTLQNDITALSENTSSNLENMKTYVDSADNILKNQHTKDSKELRESFDTLNQSFDDYKNAEVVEKEKLKKDLEDKIEATEIALAKADVDNKEALQGLIDDINDKLTLEESARIAADSAEEARAAAEEAKNAAAITKESGDRSDADSNIITQLTANDTDFQFAFQNGKYGYLDKEGTFHPFRQAGSVALSAKNVTLKYPKPQTITINTESTGKISAVADGDIVDTAISGKILTLTPKEIEGTCNVDINVGEDEYYHETGFYDDDPINRISVITQKGDYSVSTTTGNKTYNGTVTSPSVTCTKDTQGYSVTPEITYSLSNDGEFVNSKPTYTNAGTYTTYYKVKGDGYNTKSGNITTTINKAESDMSLSATSGDKCIHQTQTFTVNGNNGSVNVTSANTTNATVSKNGNTITVTPKAAGTSAGINVADSGDANHNSKSLTYTANIKATSTKSANNAKAATCTTAGKNSDTLCAHCGAIVATGTTIAAKGHSGDKVGSTIKAATCTTDGSRYKKCSVCGANYGSVALAKLGHSSTTVWDVTVNGGSASMSQKAGISYSENINVKNNSSVARESIIKAFFPTNVGGSGAYSMLMSINNKEVRFRPNGAVENNATGITFTKIDNIENYCYYYKFSVPANTTYSFYIKSSTNNIGASFRCFAGSHKQCSRSGCAATLEAYSVYKDSGYVGAGN